MKNKAILCWVIGLVIIAIVGFAVYWFFIREEEGKDDNKTPDADISGDLDSTDLDVIIGDIEAMSESDEVVIKEAMYDKSTLILSVVYPGCADHTFRLYVGVNTTEGIPAEVPAVLYHDQHGDMCEIGNTEELRIDITSVVERFGDDFVLALTDSEGNPFKIRITEDTVGISNPASDYCVEQGGKLDIRDEAGGQVGYCIFVDGSECEEWAYFRGECEPEDSAM